MISLSVYSQMSKVEKIVDCKNFNEKLDDLIFYAKMTGDNVDLEKDIVFDWMAMIDSGEYDSTEVNEDILSHGYWDDESVSEIEKKARELRAELGIVLRTFEEKTGLWIYFEYNHDDYESYFDFNFSKVLDMVVEFNELKESISKV